jgi:hypothetical protein
MRFNPRQNNEQPMKNSRQFPCVAIIRAGCALAAALGLIAATQAADAKVDTSKLPAPANKTGLTFAQDIKPILDKSCVKCHGGEKPKGKYSLETRDGALKKSADGAAHIIAGQSAKSPVIHFVADLVPDIEMPPTQMRDKFPALTKDQVALLRAWIDQGAK